MLQCCSRHKAEASLAAIQEFAELGDAYDRSVGTYSTGMRARLGFATSLITHVDILFIDEVLAVGDAEFRKKASEALKGRIRGEQTVVLVSHNMGEVSALSDQVVWVGEGAIKQAGDSASIVDAYQAHLN
ncbi:unnamed protein product [Ectocarpus sp. 12 AP-2014]